MTFKIINLLKMLTVRRDVSLVELIRFTNTLSNLLAGLSIYLDFRSMRDQIFARSTLKQ